MDTIDNRVKVVRVERVEKHPNADRLDLAHVQGWQCVTQRGAFTAGALAVYIPIDSVLPAPLEEALFPPGSKVTLSKSRVKTIKLRGAISQGMVLSLTEPFMRSLLLPHFSLADGRATTDLYEGTDLTDILGITHYEPPAAPTAMRGDQVAQKKKNPFFPVYSKLSHFKNYPDLLTVGEQVVVTEKIHGTNFRAWWAPMYCDTWWKKIKHFLGLLPDWEFVVGSHNVQLNMEKNKWTGFYPANVYAHAVVDYNLKEVIPMGYLIYGEIYGGGIQKGYTYGCAADLHELRIFDIRLPHITEADGGWLPWAAVTVMAAQMGLHTVPVIYSGAYKKEWVPLWEQGASLVSPEQAHREGYVIKPRVEQSSLIGRKILRSINPEYLLRSESDFH